MKAKTIVMMLGHKSLRGKDTFASYLKYHGWNRHDWKRIAFADKLKETVADLYNFSHEQMHGSLKDVEDTRYPNNVDPETITVYAKDDYGSIPFPGFDHQEPNPDYKPFLTPRRILQIFGQNQRALYQDIWAQYVFNQIERMENTTDKISTPGTYVITDFRFKNEHVVAKRWASEGSGRIIIPIRIDRDIESKAGKFDVSENDLDDFDEWECKINNNNTLKDLEESAKVMHELIKSEYEF